MVKSGGGRIRTCEGVRHQIYSLAHLAALEHPRRLPESPQFPAKSRHTDLAASEERGKIASGFADVKQTERFFRFSRNSRLWRGELPVLRGRKASGGTRTHNLRFTKPLLCQLSYTGNLSRFEGRLFRPMGTLRSSHHERGGLYQSASAVQPLFSRSSMGRRSNPRLA